MTDQMNTLEVLMKGRALIAKPEDWAGGFRELMRPGTNCMVTALYAAGEHSRHGPAYVALLRATGATRGILSRFNDTHHHPEVLAAYDRAIEAEWEKVQGAAEPVEAVPA